MPSPRRAPSRRRAFPRGTAPQDRHVARVVRSARAKSPTASVVPGAAGARRRKPAIEAVDPALIPPNSPGPATAGQKARLAAHAAMFAQSARQRLSNPPSVRGMRCAPEVHVFRSSLSVRVEQQVLACARGRLDRAIVRQCPRFTPGAGRGGSCAVCAARNPVRSFRCSEHQARGQFFANMRSSVPEIQLLLGLRSPPAAGPRSGCEEIGPGAPCSTTTGERFRALGSPVPAGDGRQGIGGARRWGAAPPPIRAAAAGRRHLFGRAVEQLHARRSAPAPQVGIRRLAGLHLAGPAGRPASILVCMGSSSKLAAARHISAQQGWG